MGTTRIKVIDLSSDEKQIKTSRKHAEKITGAAKIKEPEKKTVPKETEEPKEPKEQEAKEEKSAEEQTSGPSDSYATSVTDKEVKAKKETQRHKGAKYQQAKKLVEDRLYKVKEAIELLPKTSTVKFDSAVEIHLNVSEKNVKGNVNFPHSFGAKQKKLKYLIFSDKKSANDDEQIIWGDDNTIANIEGSKLKAGRDFDSVIASPKFMPKLAKIAKILGPKGMMPNPKNGTITEDFEKVISGVSESGYAYKSDPTAPIIHAKVGKISQKPADLEENLKTLTVAIGLSKIKKATLASTMGPAIKLDIASL